MADEDLFAGFRERYGDWAIVAGASEGTGRAFARQLAAAGIKCILIARREDPLQALAATIRQEYGTETITASIDLSAPDALDALKVVVGARTVGMLVFNAGADPNGARFLDRPVDDWISLVNRNVVNVVRACHHFASLMRERRRGAILLVGSGACYGGGSFMATYAASKAFELCFAESLWAELEPYDVDVLYLVLNMTDTPELRRLLERNGKRIPAKMASPEEVVEAGLARLSEGPVYNWGQRLGMRAGWRRARIKLIDFFSKRAVFGDAQDEQ